MGWLRWRWNGIRRCVAVARSRRQGRWAVLSRIVRRPTANGPWFLARFGREALADLHDAIEETGARAFIVFGTLLGARREGDFIAHDDDIDFGMLEPDFADVARLSESMAGRGYTVETLGPHEVRYRSSRTGDVPVDIFRFEARDTQWASRADSHKGQHVYLFPDPLLRPLGRIRFCGLELFAPADIDGFLAHHYGDWQRSQPDWDYRADAASEVHE